MGSAGGGAQRAAVLARQVRRGDRWLATSTLGGAVAAAIGLTCLVGFDLILSLDTKDLTPPRRRH